MRKIFITVEIEDNNLVEQQLFKSLDGLLGGSMKDYTKVPDTSALKEDANYLKLLKENQKASKILSKYINDIKLR